jgi:GNAT superfamily N-acetyltransferase
MKSFYRSFLYILSLQLTVICIPLFGDQSFIAKDGNEVRIAVVQSVQDIRLKESKDILVKSFMKAYEDVPLINLNPQFKCIGDVRRFYEEYFEEELEHFRHGNVVWLQAFTNDELVGWATFEIEANDASYMNLLVVHPSYQAIGIGQHLVFAIQDAFPSIRKINILLRKVNVGGYHFYHKLGFVDSDYQRDNFVDPTLLTGLSWRQYDLLE